MRYLVCFIVVFMLGVNLANAEIIDDSDRDRKIPIEISFPTDKNHCTAEQKCPVVFLSAGYGIPHTKYTFLVNTFNELGMMVVAIGHELPEDPPLSKKGILFQTRSENWIRGAETLNFLYKELRMRFQNYKFDELLLLGHSNGGDISAWLGNSAKPYVKSIITLDHRRVSLPRSLKIKVLSIRASDFEADKGVLPSEAEKGEYDICVVKILKAKHNDMTDYGPRWLKDKIRALITSYLSEDICIVEENNN